jgi:hypothetical protein
VPHPAPAGPPADQAHAKKSPYWDMWFEAEHDQRRRTFFASRAATTRPCATPRMPPASARRPPRRQGGLYIKDTTQVAAPLPLSVEAEEDDLELRTVLARLSR